MAWTRIVPHNPHFVRLLPRVTAHGHPDLDRDQPEGRGAIVDITKADGSIVSHRVEHPLGHSKRGGLDWSQLAAKWHEALPECDVDRTLSVARRLDDLEDVSEFLDAVQARR